MKQTNDKRPVYQVHPWEVTEVIEDATKLEHFRKFYYQGESIFTLGNGYIGIRGSFEEGLANAVHPNTGKLSDLSHHYTVDGTYLNGFYESKKIRYPESGYGFAENYQTMLNVPNAKGIEVRLGTDEEVLHLDTGELVTFARTLDMRGGVLIRRVVWRSRVKPGREVLLTVKRLISFTHANTAAISFSLTPSLAEPIRISSTLDANVENVSADGGDPRVGSHLDGNVLVELGYRPLTSGGVFTHQTKHSRLMLASGIEHTLITGAAFTGGTPAFQQGVLRVDYTIDAAANQPVTLEKFIAYAYVRPDDNTPAALADSIKDELVNAQSLGFDALEGEQHDAMARFWAHADITITGRQDDEEAVMLQQGIHFNMFHVLQAARENSTTNACSKGLTGEGYEGHYFWDTEMFAVPFFQYTKPQVCRSLLEFRHHMLPAARQRAAVLSTRGAAFAWRTINGEECSAFFPAGSAQYHINADIAYAIKHYVESTGDTQFLIDKGAEMVFETARMWADVGEYVPAPEKRFCINGVTGPDEYTAIVDNNFYTNVMAQENLSYAYNVAVWMQQTQPEVYAELAERLSPPLSDAELRGWESAAKAMYIPYSEQTGLFAQDDGFFNRAAWRWDWGKRDGKDVLLKRFHYLVIYRHQICKQADVILALYLLGDRATLEQKRRNFNYYEQITTHDSSLSTCTFSIVASEVGYHQRAYDFFMRTSRMDLDDHHGNVTDGVHVANMAGTWMCVVNGFAGLRLENGGAVGEAVPHYKPFLPDAWEGYSFRVSHRGCVLQVSITRKAPGSPQVDVEYHLVEGEGELRLKHMFIPFTLDSAHPTRTMALS